VNAGPVAYAQAFLSRDKVLRYKPAVIGALKEHFRSFISVCNEALEMNASLVSSDQYDYHDSLVSNFNEMVKQLEDIFGERLLDEDDRISVSSNRNSVVLSTTGSISIQL
jgi:hypothetical protein